MDEKLGLYSNVFQLAVNDEGKEVIINFGQRSQFVVNEKGEAIMGDTLAEIAKIIMTTGMAESLLIVLQECLARKEISQENGR